MDKVISRKMLRTMEPYHGMIYFVPEARQRYEALGLRGRRMGYFASRAAALGPVSAEVVIATFFNFHPGLVRRAIPEAWSLTTPAALLDARLLAADEVLRRVLGDAVDGPAVAEAAALAKVATGGCHLEGRPLYAAHAALGWPDEPHLALWWAQTLLREFRGDGHIAALVCEGITGCEALVLHEASGADSLAPGTLQASRAWPDDEWEAAQASLRDKGWLDDGNAMTDAGRAVRQRVEDTTDELALVCWERLGDAKSQRLRELVRPVSRAISEQAFTVENMTSALDLPPEVAGRG